MFSEMLQTNEREALLDLLAFLAAADGAVTPEEVAFIAETASRLGVHEPNTMDDVQGHRLYAICSRFERPKAKAVALAELINLAYADGRYDDAERSGVRAIARAMGADESLTDRLEAWVARGLEWQVEGRRLMGLA